MYEPLRIFGILLYKSWLVRKQSWIVKLFGEIICPLVQLIFLCSLIMSITPAQTPVKVEKDHFYKKDPFDLFFDIYLSVEVDAYYAPLNTFTFELMEHVRRCFKYRLYHRGFDTESKFNDYYRRWTLKRRGTHVIIFDETTDNSSKHLSYKIRYLMGFGAFGEPRELYNSEVSLNKNSALFQHHAMINSLTQLQICIDGSFINMKSGYKRIPYVFIQRMPLSARIKEIPIPFSEYLRNWFRWTLLISSVFPLMTEIPKVISEKFSGVNVLMSMYGISNAMNLLSWLTSGVLRLGVLLYLPLVIYFCHQPGTTSLTFIHYGNPMLFYFVLIFYLAHLLAFGIHVSAYFSRALLVTIAFLILSSVIIYLQMYGFSEDTVYLAPYVGIIFPGILFNLALEEINVYETKAEGIHFYNLFVTQNPNIKFGGSVGMIYVLTIIGTIFHFSLAVYIYAVKPGKYGVAKHPLYFLKVEAFQFFNSYLHRAFFYFQSIIQSIRNNNSDEIVESVNEEVVESANDEVVESVDDDNLNREYFETVREDIYTPGIQVENLTKVYDIDTFTKQKVQALRGVTIDFYKGQMTSLLGHNGAGKTTMISILTGMTSPTEGTVIIDGKDLKTSGSEIMTDMGLCTQENMYFSSISVADQLLFFTMVKRKDQKQSERRKSVEALLLKLKLDEKKDVLPDKLSGGQKRRLCLGMALAGDANILLLDEPTSGLDPESRRVIWNILLKMRGQKTVLISTHDMEEADVLGDRVAIMHTGLLKSYGTPLFLKRLIGQNYVEITLSIEPRTDPEKIRSGISKDAVIIKTEASRMIVKIPNSSGLPEILDSLEKRKKELGVTGFSVSLISLEQVFLKMTEENEGPMPRETDDSNEAKLTDLELYKQTIRALLSKKLTYVIKDYSIIITKIFTIIIALMVAGMYLKVINSLVIDRKEPISLPVNPKMYHQPQIVYTGNDKSLGNLYKTVSENLGGNTTEVTNNNLDAALLKRANDNPLDYNNHLIAGAEINKTTVTAFYSETATYSLSISINLLSNAILKNLAGPNYSISLSYQTLYGIKSTAASHALGIAKSLFVYIFCLTIAMFVVHPSLEFTTKIKHLQRMARVSGSTYWGTMFLFDLIEYAMLVVLIVIGFLCIDSALKLRLYGPTEIVMELLLFMLFGVSVLPFIYLFSFFNLKTSEVFSRLVNYSTVAMDLLLGTLNHTSKDGDAIKGFYSISKWICRLVPAVSFAHCQLAFFRTVATNARCYRLSNDYYNKECFHTNEDICCKLECQDGKCKKSVPFFDDDEEDIRLLESMQSLCVTAVLYFVILACKESRTYRKSRVQKIDGSIEPNPDEQVQREKSMIFERIEVLRGNKPSSIDDGTTSNEEAEVAENDVDNKMFLVYELKKSYGEVEAVKDVSFSVNRRECFVLLGTNGAGKSTTFRMMTGEEVPNHGIMYIEDKEFEKNLTYCLSQIGYCPQQDAMLKRLNAYDHLKLFARLRGIPENQVENEAQTWIDILNLNAYALQPSGSYSGGNKRRLNIGIALIGNPNLIMMDEPTTGVDPGARRSLWNVVKGCQMAGQSVVLTSHSMVECEVLSDRLAIMVDGKLVCIGASEQLKQRFGAGYDIQIKMNPEKATDQVGDIKNDMTQALNCVLIDENMVYLKYHVPPAGTTWKKMHDVMNGIKKKYDCIDDFLVSSSSLEQLFLMFAKSASSRSSSESIN